MDLLTAQATKSGNADQGGNPIKVITQSREELQGTTEAGPGGQFSARTAFLTNA